MNGINQLRAAFIAMAASGVSLLVMLGVSRVFAESAKQGERKSKKENAFVQDKISRGRKIFFMNCAACHGFDGKGTDDGPDLYDLREGDGLINQVITGGIRKEMPAFGKKLNDSDVQALIAYLRTLKNAKQIF